MEIKKIDGIENGRISVIRLSSLLTEIWGNMSTISLNIGEIKILISNTAELRKFVRGRRDFNVFGYLPMPIEQELEQIEFHYRHRALDIILHLAYNGGYLLREFAETWDGFVLAKKYEYDEVPKNWDGRDKAIKASDALAKIILENLSRNLARRPKKTKKHQLLLYLNGVKARFNQACVSYKEADKLLKKYDPKNKYEHKWV